MEGSWPRSLHKKWKALVGRHFKPGVALVVVVYNMPEQAKKTLYSLTSQYQQGVTEADYDVIIIENQSANNLPVDFIESLPANFSYHLRAETEPTPVFAANYGIKLSRRSHIALLIDGARMVTPGVVKNLLRGHRLQPESVVTVPGYHLGRQLQQRSVEQGYGIVEESRLLASIEWPRNGYSLFDIACFSGSCAAGLFRQHSESNCISLPKHLWQGLGGMDERFDHMGGGLVNLDCYRRACELPGVAHVVLIGEGTFHQFHGGVTTGGIERQARESLIGQFQSQYRTLRGKSFQSPETNPIFLGEIPPQLMRFIRTSSQESEPQTAQASAGEYLRSVPKRS
jgi:hypothetical protein